ncbi:MAG: alkaline phosphatase family protein, partial [Planctomycetota bacterium]
MTHISHIICLSVPALRPKDIDHATTPTLYNWANRGTLAELTPTFPCVTSPVQANMITGTPPNQHGVIANGFYHRDRHAVEFWTAPNSIIHGTPIWDLIRQKNPSYTSAVWHAQNIKGASADYIVTPAPIHQPDGTTKLWCYSKPDGLYQQLLDTFGHFPLQHYWGPLSNINSTKWILKAAAWLHQQHAPNFHWIYIPHLDYASQKFGPNSPQAENSLTELDAGLHDFEQQISASPTGKNTVFLIAGEYALTDVADVIYPNRILRNAGLLCIQERDGAEYIDFPNSP